MKTISVIGLGYIGLPLSLTFAERGFRVIGVDVSATLIRELEGGHTKVHEDYQEESLETVLSRNLVNGHFIPTTDYALAGREASAYVITVGIPATIDGKLDTTPMKHFATSLGQVLKRGDLVLVRSTVIPGMLESDIIPLLEKSSGLVAGHDFYFAYAAERVAEGRAIAEFQTLDVVVGGLNEASADAAMELLSGLTEGTIHVTNLRIAQAVKVIENAQRDVNIALAQEVARFAELHDVDVYELIRMANTHPRVKLLEPNIGVGGFCIPNALHYMKASLADNQTLPLFDLARDINFQTPGRMVDKLAARLSATGHTLKGSVIAVLGLGMKDNSNDIRLSPALDVIDILRGRGAVVRAYDPTMPVTLEYQVASIEACLDGADGLLVATWQREFEQMDWRNLLRQANLQGAVLDIKHRLAAYAVPSEAASTVSQ